MKKFFLAIALFSFGIVSAQAQYGPRPNHRGSEYNNRYDDRYDRDNSRDLHAIKRQARQEISEGVRRGSLNSREANSLMKQYDRLDHKTNKLTNRRGRISDRDARMLNDDFRRLISDTRRLSDHRNDRWADGRNRRF